MTDTVVFERTPQLGFDIFLDELSFEFPDAPYGLLEHQLKRAVARICERSNLMRRTAVIHTEDCVHNYILEPHDCTQVIAVMSICYIQGSKFCGPVIRLNAPSCSCVCHCHNSTVHVEGNEIVFSHPHNCDAYRVTMSVKPSPDACEFDSILHTDFHDLVIDGVRAYMYGLVDKPWSSVQRSVGFETAFLRGCSDAAVERMTGHQRGAFTAKRQRAF